MSQSRDFEGDYYQAERILESHKSLDGFFSLFCISRGVFSQSLYPSNGAMREALYASDRNRWMRKNNISSLLLFQLHPRGSSNR